MAVENPVKLSVQAMKMSSIEIFALSVDYDSKSQVAQNFFKSVQNKLEYCIDVVSLAPELFASILILQLDELLIHHCCALSL